MNDIDWQELAEEAIGGELSEGQQQFIDKIKGKTYNEMLAEGQRRLRDEAEANPMTVEELTHYALLNNLVLEQHISRIEALESLVMLMSLNIEQMAKRFYTADVVESKQEVPDIEVPKKQGSPI